MDQCRRSRHLHKKDGTIPPSSDEAELLFSAGGPFLQNNVVE